MKMLFEMFSANSNNGVSTTIRIDGIMHYILMAIDKKHMWA